MESVKIKIPKAFENCRLSALKRLNRYCAISRSNDCIHCLPVVLVSYAALLTDICTGITALPTVIRPTEYHERSGITAVV